VQILINALVKIYNNKIYSAGKDLILMRSLKIKNIEVAKNDLLKSTASAIHLIDVKNPQNDPRRVSLRGNNITEMQQGFGIYIENSTCHIDQNQIKKNLSDGIFITTNSSQGVNRPPLMFN
jgi:hypothetical protein